MSDDKIIVKCPHCENYIVIYKNEINCAIFRHGILKETYMQINPHTSKDICDKLAIEDKIFGCAKPFKIIYENNEYNAIACDYI